MGSNSTLPGTIQENLAYIDNLEQKTAALRDAVYAWLPSVLPDATVITPEDVAALYRTIRFRDTEDNRLCTPDFAAFCRRFANREQWRDIFQDQKDDMGEDESPFFYDDTPVTAVMPKSYYGRTAYMQNGFTDRAWRQFASIVPDMTAEYFTGYGAVCEEVYNGRCQFCILPVYTSTDGQLLSFRKLIGKYDLKICLETEVETAEDTFMRFALLCRKLAGWEEALPEYVDISAVLPEEGAAGGLIGACEMLGMVVTAVFTMPLEYGDRSEEFCLTLRIRQRDDTAVTLAGLALFLASSGLRYTVVGMYRTV